MAIDYSVSRLSMYSHIDDFLKEAATQREKIILHQLNDLVTKGLLVVKSGPMVLANSRDSNTLELKQLVELELKDQEYIKELEAKVKNLETRLASIQNAIENTKNIEETGHFGP